MAKPAADAVKQVATTIRLVRVSCAKAAHALRLLTNKFAVYTDHQCGSGEAVASSWACAWTGTQAVTSHCRCCGSPRQVLRCFFPTSLTREGVGHRSTRDLMRYRATGGFEHHGVLQRVQRAHARHQSTAAFAWRALFRPLTMPTPLPRRFARMMFPCRCW